MAESNDLSERELEILCLVATGASNKEIATQLYISTNTVKVHLRNIFAKIGAASRTEAAMYAVSNGLVEGVGASEVSAGPNGDGQAARMDWQTLELPERPGLPLVYRLIIAGLAVLLLVAAGAVALMVMNPSSQSLAATPQPTISPRWRDLAVMPTARFGLALAAYGNSIYAIGGVTSSGVSAATERFDSSGNSWTELAPKPTAAGDVGAAVIGGKIYVPGGSLSNGKLTNVLEIYDPLQDVWERGASVPAALSAYALAAFEGKLYLFGGWDGSSVRAAVFEYDPDQDLWSPKTPMPTARAYSAAVVSAGKIYVLGGKTSENPLVTNEVYSPAQDTGTENPWDNAAPLPEPRFGMGVTSVADIIYLIGGEGDGGDLPAQAYFPQSDEWQTFESPQPQAGVELGLVSIGPYLFSIGGKQGETPSARTSAFQAFYTISIPVIVK
jgi:DNA-binding CsgD family transcriptional regulator/N-acetylneuraminic acid mutarotase